MATPIRLRCKTTDFQKITYTSWDDLMANADNIIELDCSINKLSSLPESIGNLTQLQRFSCSMNQLTTLPESIGNLTQLQKLQCESNKLTTLPESIGNLTQLKELDCNRNQLTSLPESIENLTQLLELTCSDNQLTSLPESIGNLTQLQSLNCSDNQLSTLPESIGNLTQLKYLWCTDNQLTTLPESIGNLTQLQELMCTSNKLTTLPESIGNLTQLQRLWIKLNELTTLPESIGNLTQLQWFNCGSNRLTTLPESIGNLTQLEKFNCQLNLLITLPIQLIECRSLIVFKFGGNPIDVVPAPLQRRIIRMHDHRIHSGIYVDIQNVHSSSVQASIKQSIFNLLNDQTLDEISDDQLRELIIGLSSDLLRDETKSVLLEYMASSEEHSTLNITFADLLKKVIRRVEKSEGEVRKDLYQRLNEEMADAECKCFTGRLSRLVNVLVGFFDDIRIEISGAEQISVVIALVKARHRIGDEDEVTPEAKAEIRTELEARGYEPSVIEEWLAALE